MKSSLELLRCVYTSSLSPTPRQVDVISKSRAGGWATRPAWQTGHRVVPPDKVLCPGKELPRHHCASPDRSKVGRERMLTWFVLGLLSPLAAGVASYRQNRGSQGAESVAALPTPVIPFPPTVSSLFCGIKAQLISALSRVHLWPGERPDCIVNGTSCFFNQEQRLYNDNPEHHSNTIGRY